MSMNVQLNLIVVLVVLAIVALLIWIIRRV